MNMVKLWSHWIDVEKVEAVERVITCYSQGGMEHTIERSRINLSSGNTIVVSDDVDAVMNILMGGNKKTRSWCNE